MIDYKLFNCLLFFSNMAARLQKEGIDCVIVGLGSTPSCVKPSQNFSAMTELHPGNYIFLGKHFELSKRCRPTMLKVYPLSVVKQLLIVLLYVR